MTWTPRRRGEIVKRDEDDLTVLERKLLVRWYELALDRSVCIGCGICSDHCPKEAIEYTPAKFDGIRAVSRPYIDFDPDRCVLCGECVSICPMDAFSMKIENEERVPVIEANVFARATRKRW
jgi:4Fe-4S ferredoxin